jgi:ParB family chromosome partitioning protein
MFMSPYSTSDSQIQAKTPPTSVITLKTKQDAISVSIGDLITSNYQPRKYFAVEAMESLIESVSKDGILQPILVRPVEQKYEIVAGERRYRAALEVGLTEIPTICREMTDTEAQEYALTENLQREDLNPIEETNAILKLLAVTLNRSEKEIISLLDQKANSTRGLTDNVVRKKELQGIEEVFKRIGRMSPESFRTHRLPLLKLPENIIQAIREGNIQYTKAKEIAKLKDEVQRSKLLKDAIEDGLSLSEIKQRIRDLRPSKSPNTSKVKIKQVSQQLIKEKLWETDESKWRQIENLLDQISQLLAEQTSEPKTVSGVDYLETVSGVDYLEIASDVDYLEIASDVDYLEIASDVDYLEIASDVDYLEIASDVDYLEKDKDINI